MKHALVKEKGAVLIVSLIILLVMTVIGLAGIEVTTMEERMAGNMRDRSMAFEAAEATLREAEDYLNSVAILPSFENTAGLYKPLTDGRKRWEEVSWGTSSAVKAFTGNGFNELNAKPAYIIEDLSIIAKSKNPKIGVKAKHRYYRITARAVGMTGSSVVVLQTVYKR